MLRYHDIAMDLLFPYKPKEVRTFVNDDNNVIIADFAQIVNLQWNICQNWIFLQKSSIKIPSKFPLYKKKWRF